MVEKTDLFDEENYTHFVVETGMKKDGFVCDIEICQDDNVVYLDTTDIRRLKRIIDIVEEAQRKYCV